MEETLGNRDLRFKCSLKSVKTGDPCTATENYYACPDIPPGLAPRIHSLASGMTVEFEYGELRTGSVTLNGKFSESDAVDQ